MKKKFSSIVLVACSSLLYSQVGINTSTPSASLDIVSKGNTSATKALEINNSSGTEMVTVLDNGNVGIGSPAPDANLEVVGSVDFPTVATTPVTGTYNALGINDATGALGTVTMGAQPIYVAGTSIPTQFMNTTLVVSRDMDFGSSPLINTAGFVRGQDSGVTLSDGTTNATVTYYQAPQPGTYRIDINGSFRCSSPGSSGDRFLVNMNMWRAPGNTSYSIYDDYRIVNLHSYGVDLATPFSQTFLVQLAAGEKIAFRLYRASSSGVWGGCSAQLPTAGGQKDAMKLSITKL